MNKQLDFLTPEAADDHQRQQHINAPPAKKLAGYPRVETCQARRSTRCAGLVNVYAEDDAVECIPCWCCDPGNRDYIEEEACD